MFILKFILKVKLKLWFSSIYIVIYLCTPNNTLISFTKIMKLINNKVHIKEIMKCYIFKKLTLFTDLFINIKLYNFFCTKYYIQKHKNSKVGICYFFCGISNSLPREQKFSFFKVIVPVIVVPDGCIFNNYIFLLWNIILLIYVIFYI